MTNVSATINPIVVDKNKGTTDITTIKYEKEEREDIWERMSGSNWTWVDPFKRVQRADADVKGDYVWTLKPGQVYEVGIFMQGHGPLTTDPVRRSYVKVFCVWKEPEIRKLITDENRDFGGTWYWHQIHTNVPTEIIAIGVSRTKPVTDSNGMPHLNSPVGAPTAPLTVTNDHKVEINPLLPGNQHFFLVLVTDDKGNWDFRQDEFTTLRRKLTVEFPTVHIFNDGDPFNTGEGEFWFRVYFGSPRLPNMIKEFNLPTQDIDDWNKTSRPYSVGFAHVGLPEVVNPGQETVWVGSSGKEHDGIFEVDELARSRDPSLGLPVGRFAETVTNKTFTMDCINVNNTDFHYGADVRFSVEYVQ